MSVRIRTLIIDSALIFVFAILARLAHGGISVGAVLDTFWPFALGTVIGTVVVAMVNRSSHVVQGGIIIWITTVVAGLSIWALRHQELPHISFIIVASLMSALLLLSWRLIAARRLQAA